MTGSTRSGSGFSDARDLMNHPGYQLTTKVIREGIIKWMEEITLDGSPEKQAEIMEQVRLLQTLRKFHRTVNATAEAGRFQAEESERNARYKSVGT